MKVSDTLVKVVVKVGGQRSHYTDFAPYLMKPTSMRHHAEQDFSHSASRSHSYGEVKGHTYMFTFDSTSLYCAGISNKLFLLPFS